MKLMLLVRLSLRLRGKGGKQVRRANARSIADAAAKAVKQLDEVVYVGQDLPQPEKTAWSQLQSQVRATSDEEETGKRARRATAYTRRGFVGRAGLAMGGDKLAPPTAETQQGLKEKFRPRMAGCELPQAPGTVPGKLLCIADDVWSDMKKRLQRSGAAGGNSGWRFEHLETLFVDKELEAHVGAVVLDLVNAELPNNSPAMTWLLATRVVPFTKKSGGVRDIRIGELFYKMAQICTLSACKSSVQEALKEGGVQQGLSGGAETAVQFLQTAVEAVAGQQGAVGVSLDLCRAFNTTSRARALERFYTTPGMGPAFRLVRQLVATESVSIYHTCDKDGDDRVVAFRDAEGMCVGSPWGPVLFCLTLQPVLLAAIGDEPVAAVAIMDDITLVGSAECVVRVVQRLEAGLRTLNLTLNKDKTVVYNPNADLPYTDEQQALMRNAGLPAASSDRMAVLGACVSNRSVEVKRYLDSLAKNREPFYRCLLDQEMPSQVALLLLKAVGDPRATYLHRCCNQAVTASVTMMEQDWQRRVLARVARCQNTQEELTSDCLACAESPACYGGLGLKDTVLTANAAFVAGRLRAAPALRVAREKLGVADGRRLPSDDYFQRALTFLADKGATHATTGGLLPEDPNDVEACMRRGGGAGAQNVITAAVCKKREADLLQRLEGDPTKAGELADHISACNEDARLVHTVLPSDYDVQLSDDDMCVMVRRHLRMRLLPRGQMPSVCTGTGCAANQSEAGDTQHPLGCTKPQGNPVLRRHRKVQEVLARVSRLSGCMCKLEPHVDTTQLKHKQRKHSRRADLQISGGLFLEKPLLVDVCVAYPGCASNQNAARSPLGAAIAAEKRKENDYNQHHLIDTRKERFLSFAIETSGAMGPSALQVLKVLSDHATRGLYGGYEMTLARLRAVMVFAVHKGNGILARIASRKEDLSDRVVRPSTIGRPSQERQQKVYEQANQQSRKVLRSRSVGSLVEADIADLFNFDNAFDHLVSEEGDSRQSQ
jgi:hypothetical protein